jgi:DNA-binding transcriptional regulator YdaS (Cro superfamily)
LIVASSFAENFGVTRKRLCQHYFVGILRIIHLTRRETVTIEKPKYGVFCYGIHRALYKLSTKVKENPRTWLAGKLGIGARRLAKWINHDPAYALHNCAKAAGGQASLARLLGVSQRAVSVWVNADLPQLKKKGPGNAVERAVAKAGGQPVMAEALGVSQQRVSQWCKQGYVPAARAQEIEHTWGVPRVELLAPKLRNALGAGGEL